MTAMSDLGIVADAPAILVELARRLGIAVPDGVAQLVSTGSGTAASGGTTGND